MEVVAQKEDEDDIELSYTDKDLEEEEIGLIQGKPRKKRRSWCKCALLAFAVTLTAVALVQLADSYGSWLEVRVWPPRVVAAAHACEESLLQSYEVVHSFKNGTHTFGVQKPADPFVLLQPNVSWVWEGGSIKAKGKCLNLLVFSI